MALDAMILVFFLMLNSLLIIVIQLVYVILVFPSLNRAIKLRSGFKFREKKDHNQCGDSMLFMNFFEETAPSSVGVSSQKMSRIEQLKSCCKIVHKYRK